MLNILSIKQNLYNLILVNDEMKETEAVGPNIRLYFTPTKIGTIRIYLKNSKDFEYYNQFKNIKI